jgi:hypothetical protein
MMTLDEAWDWCIRTKRQLVLLGRIGQKHWKGLPWEGELGKDEKLKHVGADDIVADADFGLDHLGDFAVLILFSAFESILRDRARTDVRNERNRLVNPLVTRILDEAARDLDHSSIFLVLDVYKGQDVDLVEKVNQVRRYRNWVAHGRWNLPPSGMDPETAYERLKGFLDRFAPPVPGEEV